MARRRVAADRGKADVPRAPRALGRELAEVQVRDDRDRDGGQISDVEARLHEAA
jgi:hypothetical protein